MLLYVPLGYNFPLSASSPFHRNPQQNTTFSAPGQQSCLYAKKMFCARPADPLCNRPADPFTTIQAPGQQSCLYAKNVLRQASRSVYNSFCTWPADLLLFAVFSAPPPQAPARKHYSPGLRPKVPDLRSQVPGSRFQVPG